jgi:RecA/RadA recombinase
MLLNAVPETSVTALLSRIHSLPARSLPALLALLLHSAHTDASEFNKTQNLSLVVIDDLSTPVLAAYPRGFEDDPSRTKSNRKEYANVDSSAVKRTNLLKELANKLTSLAVKRNIAVLVTGIYAN